MHPLGLQISFILYQMFLIHQKFYAMWRIRIYDNFSFDFQFCNPSNDTTWAIVFYPCEPVGWLTLS